MGKLLANLLSPDLWVRQDGLLGDGQRRQEKLIVQWSKSEVVNK